MLGILMRNPIEIMQEILATHNDADKWNDSNFEHIKRISNTKVGEVGQDFIEKLCDEIGHNCMFPLNKKGVRAKQNPWDIQIDDVQFELKTATEDISGVFQFNHIRYHRPYHGIICLGVSPSSIYFNLWSKAEISTGIAGHLVSMEKGANASYKLAKKPDALHTIDRFEAELTAFLTKFKSLT